MHMFFLASLLVVGGVNSMMVICHKSLLVVGVYF